MKDQRAYAGQEPAVRVGRGATVHGRMCDLDMYQPELVHLYAAPMSGKTLKVFSTAIYKYFCIWSRHQSHDIYRTLKTCWQHNPGH